MEDIKEQVDRLRRMAANAGEIFDPHTGTLLADIYTQAADTMEALISKLSGIGTAFHETLEELDKRALTELKLFAGTNDETLCYGYGNITVINNF